jgi:hypothetical protein
MSDDKVERFVYAVGILAIMVAFMYLAPTTNAVGWVLRANGRQRRP